MIAILIVGFVPRVKMKLSRFSFSNFLSGFTCSFLILIIRSRLVEGKSNGFAIPFDNDMVCVTDSPLWKGTELVCNRSFVLFEKGHILRCTSIQRSRKLPFNGDILDDNQFVDAEIFTGEETVTGEFRRKRRKSDSSKIDEDTSTICKIACWPMADKHKSSNGNLNKINTDVSTKTITSLANKFQLEENPDEQPVKDIVFVKFTGENHKIEKRAAKEGVVKEDMTVLRWERPLIVLKFISCLTLTILVSFSVLIYFYCGMFYQECLAHMCSEVALVAAHICILAHTTDSVKLDKNLCSLTAILLQYFFQVSFLSLSLEAFFLLRIFVGCSPSYQPPAKTNPKISRYRTLLGGPLSLLFLTWGFPAVIAAVGAYFFFEDYVAGNTNCWYNAQSASFSIVVIPVGIFATLHILFIAPLFIYCDVPERVKAEHFFRARTGLNTRWASVFIMLVSVVSWATGLLSEDDNMRSTAMLITFCIFTILLGSFIPVVRISTEEQVRQRLWFRMVPNQGPRLPWPITSFDMFDEHGRYFDLLSDDPHRLLSATSQRTLLKTANSMHTLQDFSKQNPRNESKNKNKPPSSRNQKRSPVHRRV